LCIESLSYPVLNLGYEEYFGVDVDLGSLREDLFFVHAPVWLYGVLFVYLSLISLSHFVAVAEIK